MKPNPKRDNAERELGEVGKKNSNRHDHSATSDIDHQQTVIAEFQGTDNPRVLLAIRHLRNDRRHIRSRQSNRRGGE